MSPGLRFANRQRDRLAPVGFQRIARAAALQAGQRVVHDVEGILAARIVAGQDHEIAAVHRRLAHQRTLAAIAVAAAAEDRDDASVRHRVVPENRWLRQ